MAPYVMRVFGEVTHCTDTTRRMWRVFALRNAQTSWQDRIVKWSRVRHFRALREDLPDDRPIREKVVDDAQKLSYVERLGQICAGSRRE